ncbi:MAG TPA: ABC transporter permease [Gemmatimonadaceae bacterium]|nr:ABC transporter permease [Gemmatimonadaceae bacterium]
MGWYRRLVNNFRSNRLSTDLRREIEFHIAERADDLVAQGMSVREARHEARRRFGNPTVQQERMHDADLLTWLESLGVDVRYALRSIRANPSVAFVIVLSIALGIGANTAIFSLIDAIVLRTLPVVRPDELVQVAYPDGAGAVLTNPIWEELRDRQDVFSSVFAYDSETGFNLAEGGEMRAATGSMVSGDFFATLGVRPAAGRLITRADDVRGCPPIAVLSHGFWQTEYGGSPATVGQPISLSGRSHTIVGVTQEGFFGVDVGRSVQVYVPLCLRANLDARSNWFLWVVGRLKPGVTPEAAAARITALSPAVFAATVPEPWSATERAEYMNTTLSARPAANGISSLRRDYQKALGVLMTVVAVVLLIACANVANLLLARATARGREMAIRLAIGAARRRLVRQLLTESVVLATLGAVAGLVFAWWGTAVLLQVLSAGRRDLSLDLSMDGRVLLFTLAVAVGTGVLFGLAPAWRSARVDPQSALKVGGRGVVEGHSRFTIGKWLVAGQIALSLVLVVGAGLLLGSFRKLTTLDAGFRTDGVLFVTVNLRNAGYTDSTYGRVHDQILDRFRHLPGVQSASAVEITPISGSGWNGLIEVDGFEPATQRDALVYFNEVSDDFFATTGTPLVAGRDFDRRDVPGTGKVAIINETLARRFFGSSSPLGKSLFVMEHEKRGEPIEVVGIVKDAKYRRLREETPATVYLARSQNASPGRFGNYALRVAGEPRSIVPTVKATMAGMNRSIALQFTSFEEQVSASLTRDRLLATLSGFFGALALLLAMVGLYGTLSYAVARRRNELGIRIALGAERGRVVRLVLGEVSRLVAIGIVLGGIAVLVATRWVESFLYGLTARDPGTLAIATATLAAVALAAGAIPAWRAGRVNPVDALRQE